MKWSSPSRALAGGELRITGSGLRPPDLHRPKVKFGEVEGSVIVSSDGFLVARVPEGAISGPVVVATDGHVSNPQTVKVAVPIAENLHPVTNPALDAEGNIYVTFSGSRGQKVPVAIFKIDTNYNVKPFVTEMMNATAIAFDREGQMYVSSRFDGAVYRVAPNGTMTTYAEGMGVATGIAFDREQSLYVGDRNGTIFKIARDQQVFVFATLELSVSAYHLAFGPQGDLFVTGPTRPRLQNRSQRNRDHVLQRPGTAAGPGLRHRWQPVRRRLALRHARHREDCARRPSQS